MDADKFVDFLFTGTSVVPPTLVFAGELGMAIMLFVPLMIAACLVSRYRHVHDAAR